MSLTFKMDGVCRRILAVCAISTVCVFTAHAGQPLDAVAVERLIADYRHQVEKQDFDGIKKTIAEISRTKWAPVGVVMSGMMSYMQNSPQKVLDTVLPAYPLKLDADGDTVLVKELKFLNMTASGLIGKSKYQLHHPDSEVLPYLLESTSQRPLSVILNPEGLFYISEIYVKEGMFPIALAYRLEGYNQILKLYEMNPALRTEGGERTFIHDSEYTIAALFAAMEYREDSSIWLKKVLAHKTRDYRGMASKNQRLKPLLEKL